MPNLPRLLPALALLLLPAPLAAQDAPPPRVLTVSGEGRSDAKPDLAVVSLGVTEQADTAAAALAAMSGGMAGVLAALSGAGIAPADVQTGQLSLEPAYDYDSASSYPPVTGFIATQLLDVRVRDVAAVGEVLDAATAAGGNRLNGISFTLLDQAAALEEARAAAVADAEARAGFYAGAAGVTLGPLLALSEGGSAQPFPLYDARFAAEAASVPVAPGQVTVTATVTVTYAIE